MDLAPQELKYKIMSVDFDGCIVKDEWPRIGELIPGAKETIQKFAELGGKIILNTCRDKGLLCEAIGFLKKEGIPFHSINENLPERIKEYSGNDCRKISADIYIDDKDYYSLKNGGVDWNLVAEILGVR